MSARLLFACLLGMAMPLFADTQLDSDNDGFSDAYERAVGTDPLRAVSAPTLADDPDLVHAWWPLASNTVERLGTGLDAELRNGAQLQADGLRCNGTGAYVRVKSNSGLDIADAFSVSFWVKPTPRSRDVQKLIGRFSQNGANRSWAIFYGVDDRLWVFISDNGNADCLHGDSAVTRCRVRKDGQWQNIGVSYSVKDGLACVVDGKVQQFLHMSNTRLHSIYKATVDLTIGAYDVRTTDRNPEQVSNPFNGSISQIFFSKAALTIQELRELYLLGRSGNLIDYWNRDIDMDGLPDRWERDMFSDLSQDIDDDTDGDRLSNLLEYACGSDPLMADTDGDGMSDGWEYEHGTDPLVKDDIPFNPFDSDNDGLSDEQEIAIGSNPLKQTVIGNVDFTVTTIFKELK
jgi:hypothetical protein